MFPSVPVEHEPMADGGPGLVASLARYRVAVIVVVLVFAVAGYLSTVARTPVYEGVATIFLADSPQAPGDTAVQARNVQQQASRIESRSIINEASRIQGRRIDKITVVPDPDVGMIEVSATGSTPQDAADATNAVVQAYRQARVDAAAEEMNAANGVLENRGAELAQEVAQLTRRTTANPDDQAAARELEIAQAQLTALETRINEIAVDAAVAGAGIDDVEQAIPPERAVSPQPVRDTLLAALIGLLLAAALAFWRAGKVAKEAVDPATILGAPLLARIPLLRDTDGATGTGHLLEEQAIEAYQFLLASIDLVVDREHLNSILVTSASAGDGKSLTALHLARALAMQSRDVVLVDSDIRARGLTTILRAGDDSGLVELAGGEDLEQVLRQYRINDQTRLSVIPAGRTPSQIAGALAQPSYRRAIDDIIAANQLTIIDSAPLLTVADASSIAAQVDAILLVLDARTSYDDLIRLRDRLRLIPTRVLGYVSNRASDDPSAPYPYRMPNENPSRVRRMMSSTPAGPPRLVTRAGGNGRGGA